MPDPGFSQHRHRHHTRPECTGASLWCFSRESFPINLRVSPLLSPRLSQCLSPVYLLSALSGSLHCPLSPCLSLMSIPSASSVLAIITHTIPQCPQCPPPQCLTVSSVPLISAFPQSPSSLSSVPFLSWVPSVPISCAFFDSLQCLPSMSPMPLLSSVS